MATKRGGATISRAYDTARKKTQTGDLILFAGKGGISSTIKWFSGSKWSHVGMAVVLPGCDVVLLWESTMISDLKEFDTGKLVKGVRLVVLSEAVQKYEGEIAIRHLTVNRTPKMLDDLWKFRDLVRNRPYEESALELIRAAYDGPFGANVEDLSSIFCSELVAESYQVMGLLSEDVPSNEYTPGDFSSDAAEPLRLLKGTLSRERSLK